MSFTLTDANLPATVNCPSMTDDQFMEFCHEHPDLRFEMTSEGSLIVMAPNHSKTGLQNSEIDFQLRSWAKQNGCGHAGDSSTGFVLPNGARRAPDASWTLKSRINQLDAESRDGFWHLCPDLAIELRSKSDGSAALQSKMREYIDNGAQLGWLIDPTDHSVTIYRPNTEPEIRVNIDSISGEGLLSSFTLQLATVWNPLGD